MSDKDQLVKFIENIEPLSKKDFTKKEVEKLEQYVQEFYSSVKSVTREKVQSNALQLLGDSSYKLTVGIKDYRDFKVAFHNICQLSTEFFDNSGDPMMLIAYLGILSEYFLNKNITKEEE